MFLMLIHSQRGNTMKPNPTTISAVLLFMIIIFYGCDHDSNPIGEFSDVVQEVPNFTLIEGADNVNIRVTRNNDRSYFDIEMENFAPDSEMTDGVYHGWCVLKDAPIQSDGTEYRGVRLFSMKEDLKWNKLNYLLNMRRNYIRDIEGTTWREIQVAIWVFSETSDFRLSSLEGSVPFSGGYNEDIVNAIVEDVVENGSEYIPEPGHITAAFMDTNTGVESHSSHDLTQLTVCEIYKKIKWLVIKKWWQILMGDGVSHPIMFEGSQVGTINISYSWPSFYISISFGGTTAGKYADGTMSITTADGDQLLLNAADLSVNVAGNTYYADRVEGESTVYSFEVPVGDEWDEETELEFDMNAEFFKPLEN